MYYLTFVTENGDDVSFSCKNIQKAFVDGLDYGDGLELTYLSGTIEKAGDDAHYEFGTFGLPRSSFLWLISHSADIVQVIVENEEDTYDTYCVPDGMIFSYTIVNGDLSFELA